MVLLSSHSPLSPSPSFLFPRCFAILIVPWDSERRRRIPLWSRRSRRSKRSRRKMLDKYLFNQKQEKPSVFRAGNSKLGMVRAAQINPCCRNP